MCCAELLAGIEEQGSEGGASSDNNDQLKDEFEDELAPVDDEDSNITVTSPILETLSKHYPTFVTPLNHVE